MDITSRELERSDNCLFVELKFTWACGLHYLPSQPKSTLLGSHMGGWKHLVHPNTPILQTHPKTHPIIDNYPFYSFMLESRPRPEQCKEQMSSNELHTEWQRFTQNYTWRITDLRHNEVLGRIKAPNERVRDGSHVAIDKNYGGASFLSLSTNPDTDITPQELKGKQLHPTMDNVHFVLSCWNHPTPRRNARYTSQATNCTQNGKDSHSITREKILVKTPWSTR